uniref:Uncharacterized protein n=1 Tax=Arundo donax TaxID=35708 RepID=A0A0A8Y8C9_ARUDO
MKLFGWLPLLSQIVANWVRLPFGMLPYDLPKVWQKYVATVWFTTKRECNNPNI